MSKHTEADYRRNARTNQLVRFPTAPKAGGKYTVAAFLGLGDGSTSPMTVWYLADDWANV